MELFHGAHRPDSSRRNHDLAGRFGAAYLPGRTVTYGFASAGACGANASTGKNTNRTSMSVVDGANPAVNTTYCYDQADRLTSSSDPSVGTIAYDAHGNTTSIPGETHTYDAADRHLTTTKAGVTVTYTRDARDRIVTRAAAGTAVGYVFGGVGDAPNGGGQQLQQADRDEPVVPRSPGVLFVLLVAWVNLSILFDWRPREGRAWIERVDLWFGRHRSGEPSGDTCDDAPVERASNDE